MKKLPLAITLGLLAVPLAQADTVLGVYAGFSSWDTDYSGKAGEPSITLKDLNVKNGDKNTSYYIALEHPIPVVPNIMLERTNISSKQTAMISKTFTIDGTTFVANDTITSDFDLSHTDATLYYEVLDNWVNFDFGLTARKFDGYFYAASKNVPADSKKVNIDYTLPLLYLKAQFDLPFSGLSAGVQGNYVSYSGDKLTDYRAKISYLFDSVLDVGLEVGYREMSLTVDEDDIKADLKLKGPYASVIAHF
jgi:outer membrane protein